MKRNVLNPFSIVPVSCRNRMNRLLEAGCPQQNTQTTRASTSAEGGVAETNAPRAGRCFNSALAPRSRQG